MRSILFVLLIALPAQAQQPRAAEAKQRFAHGQELVAAGQLALALDEFERGWQLSHRPLFLFNIAECARQSGDAARARDSYARYLKEDPDGPMVATARARLSALGPATAPPAAPKKEEPPPTVVAPVPPPALPPPEDTPPSATLTVSSQRPSSSPARKRWPIWLGVGAATVVVGVVAISLGVTLGGHGGAACSGDCTTVDLRH